MNVVDPNARSGVSAPIGFSASGVAANIKGNNAAKLDVAVIYSERPATAAGVFTTNRVRAACVELSRERVRRPLRALVINSGNANACTGTVGEHDCEAMAAACATALGIASKEVAVASTGVIGVTMPMQRVVDGITRAAAKLSPAGSGDAARAIMTTDTVPKEAHGVILLPSGTTVRIGAMAKGAGMIHPNMATLLAFVTSDAAIEASALQRALREGADASLNMISVDGDTSTNDMVLALCNGMSGGPVITETSADFEAFSAGLRQVMVSIAKSLARDGEGATKLVEMTVEGAPTLRDARLAARSVISSNLVKTALFGEDANWGRILAAMGYSGASFDPALVDLYLGEMQVMASGVGLSFDEARGREILQQKEIVIRAQLHQGGFTATAWGCDMSLDYVRINAEYRT